MPRHAYVNGMFERHNKAMVHVEDRGYQFADGVYEVIALINGQFADERGHLDRLERSLAALSIAMPLSRDGLSLKIRELVRRNRLRHACIYIQVTRGVAKRDFGFPDPAVAPSLVITARPFVFDDLPKRTHGVQAFCVPDIRWKRRDIKTIALLPQVLARQQAVEQGGFEAWMVDDDGYVTEASASNAWIVKDGRLITRQANCDILRGVTRTAILALREEMDISLEERAFTPEESWGADEAFCSSATALITPVVAIDGHRIGNGKPGKITMAVYHAYRAYVAGGKEKQIPWTA